MTELESVTAQIEATGGEIRAVKAGGGDKAAVQALVDQLLELKARYKELNNGVPFDPPKPTKEAKEKKGADQQDKAPGEKSKKDLKKEQKKAQKQAAKADAKEGGGEDIGGGPQAQVSGGPNGHPAAVTVPKHAHGAGQRSAGKAGEVRFGPSMPPVVVYAAAALAGREVAFVPCKDHLPSLPLPDGQVICGDHAIARYLVRSAAAGDASATPGLLGGADAQSASLVDQWLDLCLFHPDFAAVLNKHLASRTYLAGYELTLADVAVFLKLATGNFKKPQPEAHLSRWWSMVAVVPEVASALQWVQSLRGADAASKRRQAGAADKGLGINGQPLTPGCPPLEGAVLGNVVTRFPPEPSGYLHIGHVKACLLNEYYARHYGGKLIIRFDDTNPSKEKDEYEEAIIQDLATLGIVGDMVCHTSDNFPLIHDYATKMIKEGKAFMDNTPLLEMRDERLRRVESKNRNLPVEESMKWFLSMCEGKDEAKEWCLRAKIDMSSFNGTMRDPVIYRMNLTPHHHTGTKYKAYPTYDLACPIVDSIEGVTHALRTTEYDDRNEQYHWFQEALGLRRVPIHSFARMNFVRTVLSKRKLTWFVEEGLVEGWFDPRFPTVQGVIRRGVSVRALREFIYSQGASKAITNMEWDKFWSTNKRQYEPTAHRYMGVFRDTSVELHLSNVSGDDVNAITIPLHPKNPDAGMRAVRISNVILLEGDDAAEIEDGEEVTLMRWGNVKVHKVNKGPDGKMTTLEGEYVPDGDFKATKKKITWLAKVPDLVPMQLVEFDYLVLADQPDEEKDEDFRASVNPKTKAETAALGDPGLRVLKQGDVIQLERRGFFRVDRPLLGPDKPLQLFMIPDGKTKAMSTLSTALAHV